MSIEQILVVMLYTLKPYVVWIVLAVGVLVAAQLVGLKRPGKPCRLVLPASLVIGVVVALLAPALTLSKLAYVTTVTDWIALVGIGVAAAIYAYLVLSPLMRRS